jgi:hypothetical protein
LGLDVLLVAFELGELLGSSQLTVTCLFPAATAMLTVVAAAGETAGVVEPDVPQADSADASRKQRRIAVEADLSLFMMSVPLLTIFSMIY